jgi:molecular chaperone DnaJ
MKWKNRKPLLSDELARLEGLDPYELLKITPDATADEVKSAYRQLVKVYHPDKADPFMKNYNEQVIKLINDAYDRLITSIEGHK